MKRLTFQPDGGAPVDFFIIAQETIDGRSYILVSEAEDGDADALILRDDSDAEAEDALFCVVEDDDEFAACARVFSTHLGDEDILLEV